MNGKRRILPRKSLRDADNTPGKYPRSLKTGDVRTGRISSFFDDLNTPVFKTGVSVSYPTSLQVGSRALVSDLTSSIIANGRVAKGVVEAWMLNASTHDSYKPFKEAGLHEQDLTKYDVRWLTGSSPRDVGLGFSAPLGEKTKLRFEYSVSSKTILNPLTASAYYFNPVLGKFEEIAPTEKTDPNPNNNSQALLWGNTTAVPMDVKYFDPAGNYAMSGSYYQNLMSYLTSSVGNDANKKFYSADFTDRGIDALLTDDQLSVLKNQAYAATSSQYIDLSQFITQPFLLEKITVELPFEAGPGWFNDRSRMGATLAGNDAGNVVGAGGPCISFALVNQISANRREIILSASIIPEGDASGSVIHSSNLLHGSSAYYLFRAGKGFPSFGAKPTVIVPSGSNSMFTGTLRFDADARISNGIFYADIQAENTSLYAPYIPATAPPITYPTNMTGLIMFINPFGRGGNGNASGRSIFGRDRITPKKTNIPFLQTAGCKFDVTASNLTGSALDLIYRNGQGNAVSPYLLMPTDKLVMVVSKYHSAPLDTAEGVSRYYYPLSQSHDVKIGQGTFKMTIFGSHVRNQSEFHDTLNQDVTSNAVHSIIGSDPVLDSWNVESRQTYSGSYTDNIITGSFPRLTASSYPIVRGVLGSKSSLTSSIQESVLMSERLRNTFEVAGTNLSVQLTSPNERYWDTMLPSIEEVAVKNKANPWLLFNSPPGIVTIALDRNGPRPVEADTTRRYDGDFQFSKNFPFAPEYLELPRKLKQGQRVKARWSVPSGVIDFSKTDDQLYGDALSIKPLQSGYYTLEWNTTRVSSGLPVMQGQKNPYDVVKMYFGFGSTNSMVPAGDPGFSLPDVPYGTTQTPTYRARFDGVFSDGTGANGGMFVEIRGWKYGILNGLETFSRCHFRRDHYGYVRDMFEQRLFSTFFETVGYKIDGTTGGSTGKLSSPVTIRFIGADGTQTDPENTLSSNLSAEATSSLPYFDGVVKNRGDINYSKIGSSLVAPFVIS